MSTCRCANSSLFDSTRAETTMLRTVNTYPTPIRWSGVAVFPVTLYQPGNNTLSRKVRKMDVDIKITIEIEPAGNLKFDPIERSMTKA
ncbi:hypothetical protein A2U01_0010409 [Trifolium medium]|uniref:Uncharacterized protein n=1 Tax=Trifolium medium TaxID=97028 RepID=A0A392MQH0_9FABA|nr:hypothetical protein [Trifolium medium]